MCDAGRLNQAPLFDQRGQHLCIYWLCKVMIEACQLGFTAIIIAAIAA